MIGIKIINTSHPRAFAERLEEFLNEHSDAKILFGSIKGIEGGKGVFAILSYDKKKKPTVKEEISLEEVEDGREMLKQANNALAEKEKQLKAEATEKAKLEKAKAATEAKLKREVEAKKALEAKKAEEIKSLEARIKKLQEVKIAEQ